MNRRRVSVVVSLVVLTVGWFGWLAPRELGGPAAYVVADGNSMEPTIRAGDLVLTRVSDTYQVGDVVAYENRELDRRVLHRIVSAENGRYGLQGDNNGWTDGYAPDDSEIIGKRWLRIPHLGTAVMTLRGGLLPIAAAGGVLLAAGLRARRRRELRDEEHASPSPSSSPSPQAPGIVSRSRRLGRVPDPVTMRRVVAGLALATVVAVVVPASRTGVAEASYRHSGEFGYRAVHSSASVYEDGAAKTGAPVFLRLASAMVLSFEYRLDADEMRDLDGTAGLDVVVSERHGWSRRLTLQSAIPFTGPTTRLEGTLDLRDLRRQLDEVEEATGWDPGVYTVTAVPSVELEGSISGNVVSDTFTAEVPFELDELSLRPATVDTPGQIDSRFAPAATRTIDVATSLDRAIPPFGLTVGSLRVLLGVLTAFAVGATAMITWWERGRRHLTEPERVEVRYRNWLVDGIVPDAARFGVGVTDADTLGALAEHAEAPIVHEHVPGHRHVYATYVRGVWYRCELRDEATTTQAAPGIAEYKHSSSESCVASHRERARPDAESAGVAGSGSRGGVTGYAGHA